MEKSIIPNSVPTTHIRRKCLWHFSTHATFWKVEQKVDGKHLEQLEREKKMHEKAFQNYFFCTISPFLKVCFHSLRKRIYFLSKILNYKSLQDIFSFWWWQNKYGKTYFCFTFLFLKNNKIISEHSEFLSSLFNIAYWFILYIWSHDVLMCM